MTASTAPWLDLLSHPLALQAVGLAVIGWLSRYFATRKDVDGLGVRVTGAEALARSAKEDAQLASDKAHRTEQVQSERHASIVETLERVSRAMEKISTEQQSIQIQQAQTAAEQSTLSRDVARLFNRMDAQ